MPATPIRWAPTLPALGIFPTTQTLVIQLFLVSRLVKWLGVRYAVLILPLIAIYRKSFPARITWAFVGLFAFGAMLAGAIMERVIGSTFGGASMGSMAINDRFTLISNVVALGAVAAVALAALPRRGLRHSG